MEQNSWSVSNSSITASNTTLSTEEDSTMSAMTSNSEAEINEAAKSGRPSDEKHVLENCDSQYLSGFKLTIVSVAICFAVFLDALDNNILATAIPKITAEFNSLDGVGWYGSTHLLTTCSFQLMFGKFYSIFSIKWVFLISISIFETGSFICGVAPNSTILIIGRAVAGLGSAGIFSGALTVIAYSVPLEKRPIYTNLLEGMYGIASVVGPLMGGAFSDNLSWRWCFYVNILFGSFAFLTTSIFFKSPKRSSLKFVGFTELLKRTDPIGSVAFIPAFVCLFLALQWGGLKYPWLDVRIITLLVIFSLLLLAFIIVQYCKGETATVPPRIMNNRSMIGGALFIVLFGGSYFVMLYYLAIWFQTVKNFSATQSGVCILPFLLGTTVVSIISGWLISRLGCYTPFTYASAILMSVGAGLITTFNTKTGSTEWIGYQIIFGFGAGAGFQQAVIAAQTSLELEDVSIGISVMVFMQLFGGALFVSISNNTFNAQLVRNLAKLLPGVEPQTIISAGATGLQRLVDPLLLPELLRAYNDALIKPFQIASILAGLSTIGAALMELKSVRSKNISVSAVTT